MSDIYEKLPFFNNTGPVFRELIGDPTRPELEPVGSINDINQGAVENSLEWHLRFQRRAVQEAVLTNATGIFLEKWASIFGIQRPPAMTDPDFVGYIIARVMAVSSALPAVVVMFPEPDFKVYPGPKTGAFLDLACFDVGPQNPDTTEARMAMSVITFPNNSLYVWVQDPARITPAIKQRLYDTLAAGSAVYVGVY